MKHEGFEQSYNSFLGTTNYLECYYIRGGNSGQPNPDYPVRFVQEATILQNCRDWNHDDRIIIFTTEDAEKANWKDGGQRDRDTGEPLDGLRTRLQWLKQRGLRASFENRQIPEGHSEEQVWQIFQRILDFLKPNDEVVFDVTHAFRSIPLLAIVVLQYAKIMKKVSLKGIYYGAFEALGPMVREIPIEDRRAPIVDLTSLNSLMDWCLATDRFLETGDVKSAGALARAGVQGILTETRGKDEAAQTIRTLGASLSRFTTMLSTCRGPDITDTATGLKQWIEKCQHLDLPSPFRPLFNMIQNRLEFFNGDTLKHGLAAVRWCADHNLIQQGFTILEEILFTYVISGIGGNPMESKLRETVSQAFKILSLKIVNREECWKSPACDSPELTMKMIGFIQRHGDLYKTVESLRQLRNDINHAGFCDDYTPIEKADRFAKQLNRLIAQTQGSIDLHLEDIGQMNTRATPD